MADGRAGGGGAGTRRGTRGGQSEGGAAVWFVLGFLSEFVWLVIVATVAGLASIFFGGRMGPASLGRISAMVVLYGLFNLLVLVPARHVAEGWLGMMAGRRPASYREPAQNLGGGMCDLAMFAGFLVLMLTASGPLSEGEDPSSIAFGFSFTLFSLLVFGVGSAVPRLWFAARRRDLYGADSAPELLVQASKRASRFCYLVFLSVGLALAGARVTALARGMAPAALHVGSAVPPASPEPPLVKEFSGLDCAHGWTGSSTPPGTGAKERSRWRAELRWWFGPRSGPS